MKPDVPPMSSLAVCIVIPTFLAVIPAVEFILEKSGEGITLAATASRLFYQAVTAATCFAG